MMLYKQSALVIYNGLAIVGLFVASARDMHYPGFFVCKVDLVFIGWAWFRFLWKLTTRFSARLLFSTFTALNLFIILFLFPFVALPGSAFDLCFGFGYDPESILPAFQLFGNVQFGSLITGICLLCKTQKFLYLRLDLLFKLLSVIPTHGSMPECIGLDLSTVKAHASHLLKTHIVSYLKDLDEKNIYLGKKAFPEISYGVMVRMTIGCNVAKGY